MRRGILYHFWHKIRSLSKLLTVGLLIGVSLMLGLFVWAARDLPPPEAFASRRISESTKIYDRTGKIALYDVHGEEKRTVIPLENIPEITQKAVIVTEDDRFYDHLGIDFAGILRSVFKNILNRDVGQGGSTITQQLIRSAVLTPEKTLSRKIKEVILSLEIEARYSKEEILGFYLNQIPFGSNIYGIEAASEAFFGKSAKDLSLSDSAVLAALPKAPTYYSPWGTHTDKLIERRNFVLKRLLDKKIVTAEEYQTAVAEKPVFFPPKNTIRAPHFVFEVREELETRFGKEAVEEGGLKVITSLDMELQNLGETVIAEGAAKNEKKWRGTNAALVAIDPNNGEVLTMVGSRDYFDVAHDGNVNVTMRPRQPGSSFKPIVYASAFKRGYTPQTIIFDLPTEFAVDGAKSYKPDNYDGTFHGPLTMRTALSNSLNVPAVKTLYLAGIKESIETARDLGITTLSDANTYGLALVLGGAEVKLLEETSAFGVFAADGLKTSPTLILRIEDNKGNVLFEHEPKPVRVLNKEVARNINDILSDNQARSLVFGLSTPLVLPDRVVAAKTGTTQDYRDGWTVGYTPSLAVGVWVGNNDNTPMRKGADGVVVAAPLWNEFMKKALADKKIETFEKPLPIITNKPILDGNYILETRVKIDLISGKRATSSTPVEFIEEKTFREIHSILYWIKKEDPLGDPPANANQDPQFINWENGVQDWLSANKSILGSLGPPPNEFDDVHNQDSTPKISLTNPQNDAFVSKNDALYVEVSVDASFGINQVLVLTDGSVVGRLFQQNSGSNTLSGLFYPQWKKSFDIDGFFQPQEHTVLVRVFDKIGNVAESSAIVYLR